MGIDHEWGGRNGARGACLRKAIIGRSLYHTSKLIMLDVFDLGVLGELGASRFSGTKRVRAKDAKDAKDAKVRKGDY